MNGAGWQEQMSEGGNVLWPGGTGTSVVLELLRRDSLPNPHLQSRAAGLGREFALPAWTPTFLAHKSGTLSAQGRTRGQTSLLRLPVGVFRHLTAAGVLSFSSGFLPKGAS